LEAKRTQLLATIRANEEVDFDDSEAVTEREPGDAADLAEASIEDSDRRRRAGRDRALLAEVDRALERWERGNFGVSEATGRPISFERLRAVPWTRYDAGEAERIDRESRR
jgi:DnaK suppressor protein